MAYDFWITAVRKGPDHITAVKLSRKLLNSLGPDRIVPREFVADLINADKATFCTSTYTKTKDYPDGVWVPGAHVHVIDGDFLTTDPNKRIKDNLGQLPTF